MYERLNYYLGRYIIGNYDTGFEYGKNYSVQDDLVFHRESEVCSVYLSQKNLTGVDLKNKIVLLSPEPYEVLSCSRRLLIYIISVIKVLVHWLKHC